LIVYDSNGNPTSTSAGNGAGTLTAASAMTYDGLGDLLTVDGPLSDPDGFGYRTGTFRIWTGRAARAPPHRKRIRRSWG
jgi:hypothetical protein